MTGDFAVQVVAFVADQFVFVEAQAQQVAAAVGQPTHSVAVRAGGGDALVEHVVFVLLYTLLWLGSVRNPEKPNRRASGAEIL